MKTMAVALGSRRLLVVLAVTAIGGCRVVAAAEPAAGQPAKAALRFSATVEAAEEVNLREDSGNKLAVADNGLQFDLRAFEIKTIKLRLGPHVARPLRGRYSRLGETRPRGPVSPRPGTASRRDAAT